MTVRDRLRNDPALVVLALCVVQGLTWTIVPALTNLALPIDVIEGYLWGREWVLATYKHPALPSWVLEFSRIVTGQIGWPAYLVSQIFIAATLWLIFLLGRDLMDARRGAAAAMLMTGVFFFTWFSPEFNHNVAQMPFWIGFCWALWRATRLGTLVSWLFVALFAAACTYTKLSCATLLLTGGLWLLWDRRGRRSLASPNPWLALAVFLILTAPLTAWLWRHNFLPLDYAERRATSANAVNIPDFILGQLGRHAGMFGLLAYAGLLWHSRRPEPEGAPLPPIDASARSYLLIMAIGPLLALMIASVALGMHLKPAWTASMSTLTGLVAVCLCSKRFTYWTYARLARISAVALVLTAAFYAYDSMSGPRSEARYRPQQASWPADAIAVAALSGWARATSAPLRIVAGETRIAGIAALKATTQPAFLTEFDFWRSPWITPERLKRDGALLVWAQPGGLDPAKIRALAGEIETHRVEIAWPRAPGKPPLNLYYAVMLPEGDTKKVK
jgi:4-amino-4-deoxy-L-arabinose transferase-like glycosyltransferase